MRCKSIHFSSLEECLMAEEHVKIVTIEKLTCPLIAGLYVQVFV